MTSSVKNITVSRTSLSLPTLSLNDESTYTLLFDGFDPGGVRYDRDMVGAKYTDGEYQVGKRKRNSEVELSLAVKGTTQTTLQSAIAALVDDDTGAFTAQYTYTVTTTIAGVAWAWTCFAADFASDWRGNWIDGVPVAGTGPFIVPITLAIPRLPNPVSGPI